MVMKYRGENTGFWEVQDGTTVLPPFSHLTFEIFLIFKVRTMVTLMGFCEGKWVMFIKCMVGLGLPIFLYVISFYPYYHNILVNYKIRMMKNAVIQKFSKLKSVCFVLKINLFFQSQNMQYHGICGFLLTSFISKVLACLLMWTSEMCGVRSLHWRVFLSFCQVFSEGAIIILFGVSHLRWEIKSLERWG